jgi:general stress protein 26
LYEGTDENWKKVREIERNDKVGLLFENRERKEEIVVDAVGFVCRCPEVRKKIWNDVYKGRGFCGPEDAKLVVLKYQVR